MVTNVRIWRSSQVWRAIPIIVIVVGIATVGCGVSDGPKVNFDEKRCIQLAAQEASELREKIAGLLPPEVAKTVSENNGCDSGGEGSYLLFVADRSTSGYRLLDAFRRHGWEVLDISSDSCQGCVAGVSKKIKDRVVEVTVYDRPEMTNMDVVARYR